MKHVDALSRVDVFIVEEYHLNHTDMFTNSLNGLKDYEVRDIVYRKVKDKLLLPDYIYRNVWNVQLSLNFMTVWVILVKLR